MDVQLIYLHDQQLINNKQKFFLYSTVSIRDHQGLPQKLFFQWPSKFQTRSLPSNIIFPHVPNDFPQIPALQTNWIFKRQMVNIVTLPFQLLPQHQSLVQIPKPKQLLIARLIPKLILARSCSNVCTHPVLTAWNLTWEGFTSPRIGLFPRRHACDS